MAAYVIAMVEITDPERYRRYMAETPGIIAKFGGRFIIRGGEKVTLEGPAEQRRVAVIEFPTMEKAKEFYKCAEYQAAKRIREGAATLTLIAIQGI